MFLEREEISLAIPASGQQTVVAWVVRPLVYFHLPDDSAFPTALLFSSSFDN